MHRLIDGYRRFRFRHWTAAAPLFARLRDSQAPHTMVIACCDSRIDLSMLFDALPGELFIHRNIANLVPPYHPDGAPHGTSAALEFAVMALGVGRVLVLGHADCSGIGALLDGTPQSCPDFLEPWMATANAARERAMTATDQAVRRRICEQDAVLVSLKNLHSFPWIAERVADGRLLVEGMWLDLVEGTLMRADAEGQFVSVAV